MTIEKPKLIRDYEGGYMRFGRPIKNGWGEMPTGTVFKITSSGITAHFESMPCDCCGFKFRFSAKGRDKFKGGEWLGYKYPIICGNCDTELPEGCEGIFKDQKHCELNNE